MNNDKQKNKKMCLGGTIEALIEKGAFKDARINTLKILGIAIISGIAIPLEYIYIVCTADHWENSNSETILGILFFVVLSIYPFYLFFALQRKIKNAEIKVRQDIEKGSPEYLLSWLKKVIDERCILAPIEEGVCVDNLTEIYLKEKAIGDKEGFLPVILQLDNNIIENIDENLHKEYAPIDNDEELSQRLITEMKENFDEQLPGEWEKFVGNEENAVGECLDGIDRVDFFWGRFVVARIPSIKASDVFKYIPMGEWNDCPRPNVHQTMTRRWNNKYEATPCFISSNTILYHVPTPVRKEDAFNLAMEHTAYCTDNVAQDWVRYGISPSSLRILPSGYSGGINKEPVNNFWCRLLEFDDGIDEEQLTSIILQHIIAVHTYIRN